MPPRAPQTLRDHRTRVRRILLWAVGGIVALFCVLDLFTGVKATPLLTLSRVIFFASYLPAPWLLDRASPRIARVVALGISVLTIVALVVMCMGTGGMESPAFSFLWAIPLALAQLFLDDPLVPLLSGLSGLLGGAYLMMAVAHRPLSFAAYWLLITLACSATATVASALFQGLHRREVELERERADALAQLAESEKRRNRAERLALLGRLAGSVAHEINNPLAFLKSNLTFALRELSAGDSPEVAEVLEEARDGATRIESIVAELSMFSSESPEDLVVCAPAELARDAVRFASERLSGIAVLLDLPESLPAIHVHPARVVRVLANLLVTAANALERAVVLGRARGELFIQVSARMEGERLVFSVEDNGPGLPGIVPTRTFEAFVGKSAGLGLQLSLEYVQRQGGQLTGRNRPEGGAQFTVTLPIGDAEISLN